MIVLSSEIVGGEQPILPLLDVTVERNAFGRQLDSFEAELSVPILGDRPVHAVFIRAPVIEAVGPDVDVLARLDDGRIVAVRERNVIATSFHPELAGETRFHRLVATMAAEHDDPGEGSGRRPPSDPSGAERVVTDARPAKPAEGRQGPRRPPDRPRRARRAVAAVPGRSDRRPARSACRSAAAPIGVFSLFRLPLGAFQPHDLMYVYEEAGRLSRPDPGRARLRPRRVDDRRARRDRLAARPATSASGSCNQVLREAAKRGPWRLHVACADQDGNVELFMQAGFARYGDERILHRDGDQDAARDVDRRAGAGLPASGRRRRSTPCRWPGSTQRRRPSRSSDSRGSACRTGSARGRTGGCRAPASPRSSGSPTSRRSSRRRPTAARTGPRSTASSRSASRRRTSRTT